MSERPPMSEIFTLSSDVVDDLLRNTMGKINKRKLRDAWLAGEIHELGSEQATPNEATSHPKGAS